VKEMPLPNVTELWSFSHCKYCGWNDWS